MWHHLHTTSYFLSAQDQAEHFHCTWYQFGTCDRIGRSKLMLNLLMLPEVLFRIEIFWKLFFPPLGRLVVSSRRKAKPPNFCKLPIMAMMVTWVTRFPSTQFRRGEGDRGQLTHLVCAGKPHVKHMIGLCLSPFLTFKLFSDVHTNNTVCKNSRREFNWD